MLNNMLNKRMDQFRIIESSIIIQIFRPKVTWPKYVCVRDPA